MNRLTITFILFLNLLLSSSISAQDKYPDGAILVVNKTSSSVSIVFTDPALEPITIPTGEGPSGIVISPDRKLAVVSNYGFLYNGNSLTLIDLENFKWLRDIEFMENIRPNSMAFLPDGKRLLVTFETRRSVGVLDIDTDTIVNEIVTNQEKPRLIAVHPAGISAYVTNEVSGTVSIIDLNNFTVAGNIPIGQGIEGIDVSPNGKEIWVANKLDNKIYVIETENHKVIKSFESPVFPTRLKFTPDGKNVIVLNAKSGHITIIDARTKQDILYLSSDDFTEILEAEFITRILSGISAAKQTKLNLNDRAKKLYAGELAIPVSINISPNGDYAFVSNRVKNSVSLMHLKGKLKFGLAGKYSLENTPGGMVFLPSKINVTENKTNSKFDNYWKSNNPSAIYFQELADASDDDFVKEIETPFLFVLNWDELEEYEALTDAAVKKEYIKDYINDKDENPLYPVNYWFLEYSGRVAHAKEKYGLKKPPFIDDRGKFYIKYGEPFKRHTDPGGPQRQEYLTSQIRNTDPIKELRNANTIEDQTEDLIQRLNLPDTFYNTLPNETWAYFFNGRRGFTVYFAEEGYFKELRNGLAGMLETKRQEEVAWYWMDLVKDRFFLSFDLNSMLNMIERWEMEYSGSYDFTDIDIKKNYIATFLGPKRYELVSIEETKKSEAIPTVNTRFEDNNLIEFHLESAQFKARNKETKIKFVTYTDPNEIKLFDTTVEEKFLNIEMEYLFRDSTLAEIYRDNTTDKFENFEELNSIFLTSETSLLPVEGDLTVQLSNTDTKEVGFRKYPVTIRDFSGDDLMLSDILYYTPIQSVEFENSYTAEEIKGSKVIPYPYPFIDRKIPVMCYFEVYNLVKDKEGTMYAVELKLTKDESGQSVLKKLGGVFRGGGEEVRSFKYQITEYDNDSKELIGFDLSKVDKGKYDLEITITSLFDEKITAAARKKLEIK